MNKLIKGNLIMTNVANKDIDMYVKSGWKLIKTRKPVVSEIKELKNVENTTTSNTIKK